MSDKFTKGQKTFFSVLSVMGWFVVTMGLLFGPPFETDHRAAAAAVAWLAASIVFLVIGIAAWSDEGGSDR